MAPSPYFFIISFCPVDMNVYARFDEIPSMTLKVIKKTKRNRQTDGRTDVKTVYPPTNTVCGGGYNKKVHVQGPKLIFMEALRLNSLFYFFLYPSLQVIPAETFVLLDTQISLIKLLCPEQHWIFTIIKQAILQYPQQVLHF